MIKEIKNIALDIDELERRDNHDLFANRINAICEILITMSTAIEKLEDRMSLLEFPRKEYI